MSDTVLRIIPTDPSYQPGEEAVRAAMAQAREAFPGLVVPSRVTVDLHPAPALVDCGANLESVRCPACDAEILDWWLEDMGRWHQGDPRDLITTTPCCGARASLNALRYDWPQGFARFVLDVANPGRQETAADLEQFARILGTPVRAIHARV